MTAVKRVPDSMGGPDPPDHVVARLDGLMRAARAELGYETPDGLRGSHLRLLSLLPREGTNITDLAERLGMTKQACGQFVAFLTARGYLDVRRDLTDRRVRLVRPTAMGLTAVRTTNRRIARLEHEWAESVGAERYAEFRRVLDELVRHGTA